MGMRVRNKDSVFAIEKKFLDLVEEFGDVCGKDFDVHAVRDRRGVFSFALTVWLMLLQRINTKHSLVGAMEELLTGGGEQILSKMSRSKKVRNRKISLNSGGFSQARSRLQIEKVRSLVNFVLEKLSKAYGKDSIDGQQIFLLDGTGMAVGNYQEVTKVYPRQGTQYGPQRYPYLRIVFAHNLANGIAVCPAHGTLKQSEQELSVDVLNRLPKGSLVIADRNFGIFSVVYHAKQAGQEVLMRLNNAQALKLSKSQVDIDQQITWTAPRSSKKGTHKSLLGKEVTGRFIRSTVKRKGHRPLVLYFFTTSKLPVDELLKIYLYRERIENDIRDIKHTLRLELVSSKSPQIIEKEILLGIMAYNLVRVIVADAANKIGLQPRQISFSRAIGVIRIMHTKIIQATTQQQLDYANSWFLSAFRQIQIYKRKKIRPSQPRKIMALRSRRCPTMKKSRIEEVADLNPDFVI